MPSCIIKFYNELWNEGFNVYFQVLVGNKWTRWHKVIKYNQFNWDYVFKNSKYFNFKIK